MDSLTCSTMAASASSGVWEPVIISSISVSTIWRDSGNTLSSAPVYSGAVSCSWSMAVWNWGYCSMFCL